MDMVSSCVGRLPGLFQALLCGDTHAVEVAAEEISKLEHVADLSKNDIRNHLPKSLFLPVDREALLDILAVQDQIADQAEAIAHLAAMREFTIPETMQDGFSRLCEKALEAFWLVREVIKELDELVECSFGGMEAAKVKEMIEKVAFIEYETSIELRKILKILYHEDSLPHPLFHLAMELVEQIGQIARHCEKLANRVRIILELK